MSLSKIDKDIYLHNAFRIFNLPINATQNKVRDEFSQIEGMVELKHLSSNEPLDVYNNRPFPITPNPNFRDYQDARNSLSQSRDRFIQEIFWFWPDNLESRTDPTIMALRKSDIDEALKLWKTSRYSSNNSSHNLAVYNHIMAIDKEENNPGDLGNYWTDALNQWNTTLSSNKFKTLTLKRVQILNDPTIKEDYVEDIFRQLPLAILSINAKYAIIYYQRNLKGNFKRHLNYIKNSKFDDFTKNEALKDVFDLLYNSISEKHEEFKKQEFKRPNDILKIESFLNDIEDDLNLLKNYFSDNYQYQTLSDNIALDVKREYVNIVNKADSFDDFNLHKITQTFTRLKTMAYTSKVKNEIQDNIHQLEEVMTKQKEQGKTQKLQEKILDFLENGENKSISQARKYADEIERELSLLDTDTDVLSEGFAISLKNYVVATINNSEDIEKTFNNISDLKYLLETAKEYATDSDTKEKIDDDLNSLKQLDTLSDLTPQQRQTLLTAISQSGSGSKSSNYSSGVGSSTSSSSDSSSAAGCIVLIIIIIIIAVILHFIGIF